MDIWRVRGGNRLEGACFVQGSKNASLPILAASIVCPTKTELMNVPQLNDVDAALRILRHLGCKAEQRGSDVYIDSHSIDGGAIPRKLMEEMRSSVMFMGALLARCGEARLSLPGGCQLGKRPIDIHLAGLRALGAHIEEDGGEIYCRAERLVGTELELPFPSVGATENIMLAACRAKGTTVILGAAREPEIVALQDYLLALGAEVSGAGSSVITIEGFHPKKAVAFRILPDRIAASTLLCAAAACGGDITLIGVDYRHFYPLQLFLNASGCDIMHSMGSVRLRSDGDLRAVERVSTAPYPGFPTDAQPLLMAALLKAKGTSIFEENIFSSRYRHTRELVKLGADIELSGRTATVKGVSKLHGAKVRSTDLRGGAALVIAGLAADGRTLITDHGHISRGYEGLDYKLRSLGADIYTEK